MAAPDAGANRVLRRHIRRAGLLRAVQPRALATRDGLLQTGRQLLNGRDFEALSIADLAAANGLSVGSFYGRFRDKEAYFALLQELVTSEWLEVARRAFAPGRVQRLAPDRILTRAVREVVRIFRADRGFVRAALRHASTRPTSWTPLKRTGAAFAEDLAGLLVPHLEHLPRAARAARVHFAMQVLYGTLVNAVLNDPGPLMLADRRFEAELARMLSGYLGLEDRKSRDR